MPQPGLGDRALGCAFLGAHVFTCGLSKTRLILQDRANLLGVCSPSMGNTAPKAAQHSCQSLGGARWRAWVGLKVISHPAQPCAHIKALGSAESLLPCHLVAAQDPSSPVYLHAGTGTCAGLGPELAQSRLPRKVC